MAERPKIIIALNWLRGAKAGDIIHEKEYMKSYGCVFSAMRRLKQLGMQQDLVWVGGYNDEMDDPDALDFTLGTTIPVHINKDLVQSHYVGFCKSMLWRLLHYETTVYFRAKEWQAYKEVNALFADAIASIYKPGDLVFIHDYHLMLLPAMLRDRLGPAAGIGFFIHTPFPTSELFRCLPTREDLLKGMLGADLVGFQTWDYSRHFMSSCRRSLPPQEVETCHNGVVVLHGDTRRQVELIVCPTGIDPQVYEESVRDPETTTKLEELQQRYGQYKVIVGRDPLDSTKGIIPKLLAFEALLNKHPSWRGKVVLIQVCGKPHGLKSKEVMEDYKKINQQLNEHVGRINGKWATPGYWPLVYITSPITWSELCAFYRMADVFVLSSLRDGLNLTPHEFTVCQVGKDDPGAMVISEFAGISQSLAGTIRVNPWDFGELVESLNSALTMDVEERRERFRSNYSYVKSATAVSWANTFLSELKKHSSAAGRLPWNIVPPRLDSQKLSNAYHNSKRRLIFLDYDGTLTPIVMKPQDAKPSARLIQLLTQLTADPRNSVYVISGRDKEFLEANLGQVPGLGMSAEHGCFNKASPRDSHNKDSPRPEWENFAKNFDDSWRKVVREIFEDYQSRTPGSEIEFKTINTTWHYRNADTPYAEFASQEMVTHLTLGLASRMPIEVLSGKKCIEVRPKGINKGIAVRNVLASSARDDPFDFVVCVGDDKTDEDMFAILKEPGTKVDHKFSVVVEKKPSEALSHVSGQNDVLDLLEMLAANNGVVPS